MYASNTTSERNYKPMTPWITMHRLFHLFNLLFHGKAFKESHLSELFEKIVNDYYTKKSKSYYSYEEGYALLKSVMTMASARNDKLNGLPDAHSELGAQFVITGKITFNELPKEIKDLKLNLNKEEEANQTLEKTRIYIEKQYHEDLKGLYGKLIII